MTENLAAASGTFDLGGDLTVNRLGYGAMRITGRGVWGDPADPDEAVRVLRRAVELGVNLIDTADSYGPFVSEQLIRTALHPYPDGLVIATKGGLSRQGPNIWTPIGRPEYLRQQAELSLRNLGVERLDLLQLHRIDPQVPVAESIGELRRLQQEGKVLHIGLSEVSVKDIKKAQREATIVSVQNRYNMIDRGSDEVLEYCEANGIAFIPWAPVEQGRLPKSGPLAEIAERTGASPMQVAIAWLLRRSPVMLPIPGTSKVAHLEDNMRAATVELTDADMHALDALRRSR
jgi:aryl-alcohol dehydrogenase-like predicted oxidoreductase